MSACDKLVDENTRARIDRNVRRSEATNPRRRAHMARPLLRLSAPHVPYMLMICHESNIAHRSDARVEHLVLPGSAPTSQICRSAARRRMSVSTNGDAALVRTRSPFAQNTLRTRLGLAKRVRSAALRRGGGQDTLPHQDVYPCTSPRLADVPVLLRPVLLSWRHV